MNPIITRKKIKICDNIAYLDRLTESKNALSLPQGACSAGKLSAVSQFEAHSQYLLDAPINSFCAKKTSLINHAMTRPQDMIAMLHTYNPVYNNIVDCG